MASPNTRHELLLDEMPERGGYESKFLREGIDYLLLQYHKELSSPYR